MFDFILFESNEARSLFFCAFAIFVVMLAVMIESYFNE